ncbi:MAG: Ig-like domain-containing protein [Chloroflexi bacterium]|nr:Ig-like domain-containing protein [Chloroflexota bacterium]
MSEAGTNANATYTAGTGSSATGDTYSFGATGNSERAFGGLQSGSLTPTIGSSFTNNTGQTITSLDIAYMGEQWRLGATGRQDRLDFQYSLNATSLTTGAWTNVDSLDFNAPITTGTAGALDGNLPANRVNVSASITGLSILDGSTFWIRWTDFNATGADDGLAVDDFSLTANGTSADAAPSVTSTTPADSDTNVAVNADITINFSEDVTLDASWYAVSCAISGSHTATVTGGPQNWTINPDVDFANSETCTVTIDDASVHDVDANDPPDTMVADHVFSFTTAAAPVGDVIHISQVYGGGGNSGATYTHDFIELFNAGTTTINLTGWSVQYAPPGYSLEVKQPNWFPGSRSILLDSTISRRRWDNSFTFSRCDWGRSEWRGTGKVARLTAQRPFWSCPKPRC